MYLEDVLMCGDYSFSNEEVVDQPKVPHDISNCEGIPPLQISKTLNTKEVLDKWRNCVGSWGSLL